MPMGDLPGRAFQELDPEAHIVTICHHGVRSLNVAVWLRNQGFDLLIRHVREGGDRSGLWRTAGRLVKLGSPGRAARLAATLAFS